MLAPRSFLQHGGPHLIATRLSPRRALVPALVLLTLPLAGCGGDVRSKPADACAAEPVPPKDRDAASMPVAATAAAERKIHIDNFTYDPAEVTVAVGTKVTWVNRDDVPHTATSSAKPKVFDSKTLDTDQ